MKMAGCLCLTATSKAHVGRDILKHLVSFKGMAAAHVQDDKSCLFWLDLWNNRVLHQDYPFFHLPLSHSVSRTRESGSEY